MGGTSDTYSGLDRRPQIQSFLYLPLSDQYLGGNNILYFHQFYSSSTNIIQPPPALTMPSPHPAWYKRYRIGFSIIRLTAIVLRHTEDLAVAARQVRDMEEYTSLLPI